MDGETIDNKLNKAALRKIKEAGNYQMLKKIHSLLPEMFKCHSLHFLYDAFMPPERFYLVNEKMQLSDFFEINGIKFSFLKKSFVYLHC